MLEAESKFGMDRQHDDPFMHRVSIELSRAERYRIFVSLVILDLGFLHGRNGDDHSNLINDIIDIVAANVRVIDVFADLGSFKLAILMPETQRQGAEAAGRRLTEKIRENIEHHTKQKMDRIIPLEMASFPDAAGTKSIHDIVQDYQEGPSQN